MSNLYTNGRGYTRKRSKDEANAAMERIRTRTIVVEHGVLRSHIMVPPFNFIYQIFQESGWLSLFGDVNIYPRLVREFYMNMKSSSHMILLILTPSCAALNCVLRQN